MSKETDKKPTEENKDGKPEETGKETGIEAKKLVVEHLHKIITEKVIPKESSDVKPEGGETNSGEGETEATVDKALEENKEAIIQAEKDKKEMETKIKGLEKRLNKYDENEDEEKMAEIEEHIADLKKAAGEKDIFAKQLKTVKNELTETKERLGERETQLGAIAMKRFEEEKNALVKSVKSYYTEALGEEEAEKRAKEVEEKITSPEVLEQVKGWMAVFITAAEEENEDDESDGSPSIHKGGSDLSKTGGKVPLEAPTTRGQMFEGARDVINTLYDAYETQLFLKETGKEGFDHAKFMELTKQMNKLWRSVGEGIKARGGKILGESGKFAIGTCPFCKHVFIGDNEKCPKCDREIPRWEREKLRKG